MIKSFEIDRSKWRYGGIIYNSARGLTRLLNPNNGYKCCLGFYSLACGFTEDEISGKFDLDSICKDDTNKTLGRVYTNSRVYANLMKTNDLPELSRREREEAITNLFKEAGVEVVFVGEYEDLWKQQ